MGNENRMEVLGIKGVVDAFDDAPEKIMLAVRKELPDIGDDIVKNIKLNMRNTPKDGIESGRGRNTHTASSAGNAPAVDSGNLIGKIVSFAEQDQVEIGALDGAPYAVWLEEGTKDGKLEARPWLAPAIEEEKIAGKIIVRAEEAAGNL